MSESQHVYVTDEQRDLILKLFGGARPRNGRMVCILSIEGDDPKGWIIAADIEDAALRAEAAWLPELAEELRTLSPPYKSKTMLTGGYIMLT